MLLNLSMVICLLKLSHGSLNGEISFKTIWDQTHFCQCSGLQFWKSEDMPVKGGRLCCQFSLQGAPLLDYSISALKPMFQQTANMCLCHGDICIMGSGRVSRTLNLIFISFRNAPAVAIKSQNVQPFKTPTAFLYLMLIILFANQLQLHEDFKMRV